MNLVTDVLTVVTGVVAGALSSAFGIGGAAISTPAIRALGVSASLAIATTLPSILPGVIAGVARYRGRNLIRHNVLLIVAPAGIVGAVLGSLLSQRIPGHGHVLMVLTAALLVFMAIRLGKSGPSKTEEGSPLAQELDLHTVNQGSLGAMEPSYSPLSSSHVHTQEAPRCSPELIATQLFSRNKEVVILLLLGLASGAMSGLLGLGGGIILVPAFVDLLRMPLKQAIATSLVCVGLLAIPSIVTHAYLGDINWRVAAWLTIGTIPGAHFGVRVTLASNDVTLRRVAALVLAVIATVYGASEILAMVR